MKSGKCEEENKNVKTEKKSEEIENNRKSLEDESSHFVNHQEDDLYSFKAFVSNSIIMVSNKD